MTNADSDEPFGHLIDGYPHGGHDQVTKRHVTNGHAHLITNVVTIR